MQDGLDQRDGAIGPWDQRQRERLGIRSCVGTLMKFLLPLLLGACSLELAYENARLLVLYALGLRR